MKNKDISHISELSFDEKDISVFKIKDIKTRISVIQNYFFPRLEFLLKYTLYMVQSIYHINPYDKFIFSYCPHNRKDPKNFKYNPFCYIGLVGKRTTKKLNIKNEDGSCRSYHSAYLTYTITDKGQFFVRFFMRQKSDKDYYTKIKTMLKKHSSKINAILNACEITHQGKYNLSNFPDCITYYPEWHYMDFTLVSSKLFLPVNIEKNLFGLISSFIALYPILEITCDIATNHDINLATRLKQFKEFWLYIHSNEEENYDEQDEKDDIMEADEAELPELESYKFIRAGLWWKILARDNWTCQSCGRTAKDGVTLEVDHIIPRSKGGSDDEENLQTLCKKCNIGKSNKDSTNLRAKDTMQKSY